MDINKYAVKFLVRNKYCSLPGLGVFELKREAASVQSGQEKVSPPRMSIRFNPVGSIDDTFASFVASSENVSISNASNHIREYCKTVKETLAAQGRYEMEALGTFVLDGQLLRFEQAPQLDLGAEPAPLPPLVEKLRSADSKPDYSYLPSRKPNERKVLKIMIPVLSIGLLATAAYFGYDYYRKNNLPDELPAPPVITDTLKKKADTIATQPHTDSLHTPSADSASLKTTDSTHAASQTGTSTGSAWDVAVLSYQTESAAGSKADKLKRYGNDASVQNRNGMYYVAIHVNNISAQDTTRLVDSLRKFFNPKGPVFILK